MPVEVSARRFEDLVEEALAGLPPEIEAMLDNVAVLVTDGHPHDPLGRYEGVPLTDRGGYGLMEMPDRITLREKNPVTHDVNHYVFDRPEGLDFEPGQATALMLDREGWRDEDLATLTCLMSQLGEDLGSAGTTSETVVGATEGSGS